MSTALVTGANGFIGRAVAAQLKHESWHVIELNHQAGDIAATATWANLPKADVVIHLAAKSFVPDSWTQSAEYMRVNVAGTEQALSYCRTHKARMVLASTYLYGTPQNLPVNESHLLAPNTPYAVSKRLAEELCEFASTHQGIATTCLRVFNVFGHGQREEFLIPSILAQIKAGKEVRVKDLTPRRDYIYLADVADAFVSAAKLQESGQVFNIGMGHSHSVREIINAAQAAAQTNLPVSSEGVSRPNEVMDVVADNSKAQQLLGWAPKWTLQQGLQDMCRTWS